MELFRVFGSVFIRDEATPAMQNLDRQGRSLGERMGKLGKSFQDVGKKMSTFVTLPILAAGAGIAKAGMDFEATGAKYETVFAGMTEQADAFLLKFKELTPASMSEAKSMASGIQDLLVPMGFARDEATNMTGEFMHVAGALANFNSGTHTAADVTDAMAKAALGEVEMLKSLGIQLDQETIKRKAYEMGLAKQGEEVTKMAKTQVILKEIYAQSGDALAAYTEESLDATTRLGLLKAEIIDVATSFGMHLLPIITTAIEFVRDMTERFGNLSQEQQQTILIVGAVVAALGPLVFIIGKIITLLPILKTGFLFLTGPIGIIIAAVALLTAGVIYLWKTNETFRNEVLFIWGKIKDFISVSIKFISNIIKKTTDGIKELWELWGADITAIATKYFEAIKILVDLIFAGIKWTIEAVTNEIKFLWDKFGSYILTFITMKFDLMMVYVRTIFEVIKGIISQALKIISGAFDVFIGLITGDWGRMWDGMKTVAKGAANMIISVFNGVISGAEGMINAVSKAVNSLPKFSIPDWVPGIGGGSFGLPRVPTLNIPRIPAIDGSHENGLDNVPFDGYVAQLHKGERVLTAQENKRGTGIIINITGNTIMGDRDADRFGDMLVSRLEALGVT